jgi:hypothetical protein
MSMLQDALVPDERTIFGWIGSVVTRDAKAYLQSSAQLEHPPRAAQYLQSSLRLP